jgi:hypothetical protein
VASASTTSAAPALQLGKRISPDHQSVRPSTSPKT